MKNVIRKSGERTERFVNNVRGFTLIELLVVISIIGVLLGVSAAR